MPNVDALCFPSIDENGLPTDRISEDKIMLDCLVGCFHEFNEGRDNHPEQLDDLRVQLMDNLGVEEEQLRAQHGLASQLKAQLTEIAGSKTDQQDLVKTKVAMESDIQKMETAAKEMELRCMHYKNLTKKKIDKSRLNELDSSTLVELIKDYMGENQSLRRENGDLFSVRDMMLRFHTLTI